MRPDSLDPGARQPDGAPNDITGSDTLGTGGQAIGGSGGAITDGSGDTTAGGIGGTVLDLADAAPDVRDDQTPSDTGAVNNDVSSGCKTTGWKATASNSVNSSQPSAAIDGNPLTHWSSGRNQDGTDWFQVDFEASVRVDAVVMENVFGVQADYPGAFDIVGSTDGMTFDRPLVTGGKGAETLTVASFDTQTIRAIRIHQTGTSRSGHWWQIGELRIDCPSP